MAMQRAEAAHPVLYPSMDPITVNGTAYTPAVPAETPLIDFIRDTLGLKGTKLGCGNGECGACTVLLDGRAVCACILTVGAAAGGAVTTIEGLGGESGGLHRIQAAFLEVGALQCGFCTSGMIMATAALLDDNPSPDRRAIREGLNGNICRCTGYTKIVEAVEHAARGA